MKETRYYEAAVFSDKGSVRGNNEDNMYFSSQSIVNERSEDHYSTFFSKKCSERTVMAAVFDGMGGSERGEVASLVAAQQMERLFRLFSERAEWTDEALSEQLFDYKTKAEEEIRERTETKGSSQPGATCCGFLMRDGALRPFWMGDSRLYLLRNRQLGLLTKDHTVAQEKIDRGLITAEEAVTLASWHHITAYIGDGHSRFSLGDTVAVEPGDKYLLCTDGISDKFSQDEIADAMAESPSACMKLFERGIREDSEDNATAILFAPLSCPKGIGSLRCAGKRGGCG